MLCVLNAPTVLQGLTTSDAGDTARLFVNLVQTWPNQKAIESSRRVYFPFVSLSLPEEERSKGTGIFSVLLMNIVLNQLEELGELNSAADILAFCSVPDGDGAVMLGILERLHDHSCF